MKIKNIDYDVMDLMLILMGSMCGIIGIWKIIEGIIMIMSSN